MKSQQEKEKMEKYSRSYSGRNHKRSSHRHYRRSSRSRSRSSKRNSNHRNRRSYSRSPHRSHRRRSRSHCSRRYRSHKSRSYSRSNSRSRTPSHQRDSVSRKSRSNSATKNDRKLLNKNKPISSTSKQIIESSHQSENLNNCHRLEEESTQNIQKDSSVKTEETCKSGSQSPLSIQNYPVPRGNPVGDYYNLKDDEPIDKEKIHKDIEEKLRIALAKEGKVYPLPKAEPSHPVFANDGSFIEIFKKMQQQQKSFEKNDSNVGQTPTAVTTTTPTLSTAGNVPSSKQKYTPPPPMFGRRRGGKILKTGVVAKPKLQSDNDNTDPKDFWSIYLREVKKYKNTACDSDGKTRPLVK